MKNCWNQYLLLVFTILILPSFGSAQEGLSTDKLRYKIDKVLPYIPVNKAQLSSAQSIVDLNPRYKPEWVKEYINVEVLASHNGQIKKVAGKNAMLSAAQKEHMMTADANSEITIHVRYLPENNLKINEPKELHFSFTTDPDQEASYPGGQETMAKYLKKNAIDKIPEDVFDGNNLAAIKFAVSDAGQVEDVHLFESSKNEAIDKLLLEAICSMPNWTPASYSNGLKVRQEFALTVGNMESCVINLLSIRMFPPEAESPNK